MSKWVIGLLILIFLALVANLVFVATNNRSFVDTAMLQYGLFGLLVLGDALLAVAGFLFVLKANQHHEKSAFIWARRGYLATFIVVALLAMAPWVFIEVGAGHDRAAALIDMSIILLLFGVPSALFTMAYYREFRRVTGGGSER